MTRVTIDAELRARLHNLVEPLELCDESGMVIAHVRPVFDPSQWEPLDPQISEEELDELEKSTVWYTTAEVLEHLKNL
jgi:hypothetical protein